jgi:myo-inositol 2-dehydrogenase / D-chiro-inositol 1-dehydrogenase
MPDKIRLGFIGCCGIVRSHLDQGLKDFPDVEFAGWCDVSEANAAARREQVGGRGVLYTEVRRMLDESKPDAVFIMLPPFAHGEAERLVLDRNLPFFVEKPVAIDRATAAGVWEGVQKRRLITCTGYMTRYRQSVQRVRSLLQEQKPVMLHGGWMGAGPKPDSPIYGWWVRKDRSGGQFLEQTTHTIDLSRYLFGEVISLCAVPIRNRRERPDFYTIEEASMVQLCFANGAAGTLYSSCCTAGGGGVSLTVWGTDLHAVFSGWNHDVKLHLAGQETEEAIPGEANIFAKEDRAFIDSVKAGRNLGILSTYEDGYRATVIACAASDSMASGQPVELKY